MSNLGVNTSQLASLVSQSTTGDQVGIAVLKKALESERMVAAGLLQALPPVPALAVEGSVGTLVNVRA